MDNDTQMDPTAAPMGDDAAEETTETTETTEATPEAPAEGPATM